MKYVNLSGYEFISLSNLEELRPIIKQHCIEQELKGSILLSTEGINSFLSGTRESLEVTKKFLIDLLGLKTIEFKESPSTHQPFKRMLVKIKKEIITMGVPSVQPDKDPAPFVEAKEFKEWLDKGEEVIILDTRNDYEIALGKFKNAKELNLKSFRDFPDEIKKQLPEWQNKKIVSYCTGGIRCEKAAPFMIAEGFKEVYQLQGGILKYFEECGQEHYEGECFVFDKRVALNASLEETTTVQCFACRMPLTPQEQLSPDYVIAESCPHCIHTKAKTQTIKAEQLPN